MRAPWMKIVAAWVMIVIASGTAWGQTKSKTDPAKTEVQLSDQQRAELRSKLERQHTAEIPRPATIGTALPAGVNLGEIPASVTSLVPAYAGHRFVWVQDDLVIVDPTNRVVMAVVTAQ